MKHLVWIAAVMILFSSCGGETLKTKTVRDETDKKVTNVADSNSKSLSSVPENGIFAWQYRFKGEIDGNNENYMVSYGRVLFRIGNEIVCLDAITGEKRWTTEPFLHLLHAETEKYIVYANGKKMTAIDGETGAKIWTTEIIDRLAANPKVVDGKIYYVTQSKKLCCNDLENGANLWTSSVTAKPQSNIDVKGDNICYVSRNTIYCFSAEDGKQKWESTPYKNEVDDEYYKYNSPSPTVIVDDEMVYCAIAHGKVECLNLTNGEKIWNFNAGNDDTPLLGLADDRLMVTGSGSVARCLDKLTGNVLWSSNCNSPSSPTFSNGMILLDNNYLDINGKILFTWDDSDLFGMYKAHVYGNVYYLVNQTNGYSSINCLRAGLPDILKYDYGLTGDLLQYRNDGQTLVGSFGNEVQIIKDSNIVWRSGTNLLKISFDQKKDVPFLKAGSKVIVLLQNEYNPEFVCVDSLTGKAVWHLPQNCYWVESCNDEELVLADNSQRLLKVNISTGKLSFEDRPIENKSANDDSIVSVHNLRGFSDRLLVNEVNPNLMLLEFRILEFPSRILLVNTKGGILLENQCLNNLWQTDERLFFNPINNDKKDGYWAIDIKTNRVVDSNQVLPTDAKQISINYNRQIEKKCPYTQEELLKRTGVKLPKSEGGKGGGTSYSLESICFSGYILCSSLRHYWGDGGSDENTYYDIKAYDSKTWQPVWTIKESTSRLDIYGGKLAILDGSLLDAKNGKTIKEFKDYLFAEICGNFCFFIIPDSRKFEIDIDKQTIKLMIVDLDKVCEKMK